MKDSLEFWQRAHQHICARVRTGYVTDQEAAEQLAVIDERIRFHSRGTLTESELPIAKPAASTSVAVLPAAPPANKVVRLHPDKAGREANGKRHAERMEHAMAAYEEAFLRIGREPPQRLSGAEQLGRATALFRFTGTAPGPVGVLIPADQMNATRTEQAEHARAAGAFSTFAARLRESRA